MNFHDYQNQWATIHGTTHPKGLVRVWLRFSYSCATPFLRLNPNTITLLALIVMAAAIYSATPAVENYFLASALIFSVGLVDSLDGIVAVRAGKTSSWGAFLDGVVDRFIDIGIGILLIVLGASVEVAIIAISLALVHEYMRARAGGLGFHNAGVITLAEKPTRIAIGTMFLLACGVLPEMANDLANVAATVWLALGLISFAQLMFNYRRTLKQNFLGKQ